MSLVKGDRVEIVVELGGGETRTYEIVATRAGRRVETTTGRGIVEVTEVTRTGEVVRTARFMQARVIAVVEHPADDGAAPAEPSPPTSPGWASRDSVPPMQLADLVVPESTVVLTQECQKGVIGDLSLLPALAESARATGMIENVGRIVEGRSRRRVRGPALHRGHACRPARCEHQRAAVRRHRQAAGDDAPRE